MDSVAGDQLDDPDRYGSKEPSKYEELAGYENELDWSKTRPGFVYRYAEHLRRSGADSPQRLELFEITNRPFFERLCRYFSDRKKEAAEKTYPSTYRAPEGAFTAFTLD